MLFDPGSPGPAEVRGFGPGMAAAADHVIGYQCANGGWGWPHAACPTTTFNNITGPIGLGLLHAYSYTGDPNHLAAAVAGGDYDLTFTYPNTEFRLSAFTPYFLLQLGGAYATHAETEFFDELTANTYGPADLDTHEWIAAVQAGRSGSLINLRPWDLHLLPAAAAALGNTDSTTPLDGVSQDVAFLNSVLDGLDTLDQDINLATDYGDIIGLAGGVRGIALHGTTSFPAIASPNHPDIDTLTDLCDLADVLAGYQNPDGSWYWLSDPGEVKGETDKDTQTTAYAVLALLAAEGEGCGPYTSEVADGREWLSTMQLPDGGFRSYPTGGENIEVEAEALNALVPDGCTDDKLAFQLAAGAECVQPGETIVVELHQLDLTGNVRGFQAFAQFDSSAMTHVSNVFTATPYALHLLNTVSGNNIDLAAGIDDFGGQPVTDDDALLVTLSFTAGATEGPTNVSFRSHLPPSRFTDPIGQEVTPCLVESPAIVVDGTDPVITCPIDVNIECDASTDPSNTGEATATDNLDSMPDVVYNDTPNLNGCDGTGTITRTWTATDCAGNIDVCVQTIIVEDTTDPAFTNVPADIVVSNDPGVCDAMVNPGMATASDNCNAAPTITATRSDGLDPFTDPYPAVCECDSVAGTINTSELSQNAWFSDDTRADGTGTQAAGTNLVSDTLTDDPEATATGIPAHDADIVNQIIFGPAPGTVPPGTHTGAVHLQIAAGAGSGKSQISHRKDDGTGHAPGSVFGPGVGIVYSWMGDGTSSVTASLKFGIKTSEFASTPVSSRTGENAWDKLLIYEPGNLNGGVSDGTWRTEVITYTSGTWWFFDRTAGAGTIGTPMTLQAMSTSGTLVGGGPKTVADVYALITDSSSIITSVQVGIGSANAGGSVYVNQVATNFYRPGEVTTFGCAAYTLITWKVEDCVGNFTTAEQRVTVYDTEDPLPTCPGEATVECDEGSDPSVLLATSGPTSGGIAVYYNATGPADLSNAAYIRAVVDLSNDNGAELFFDTSPRPNFTTPEAAAPGDATYHAVFSGLLPGLTQFGLDFVRPLPTSDGSIIPPTLHAWDNTNGTPAGAIDAGPTSWAINDYKGGSPNGPINPVTSPVNSVLRGAGTDPAVDIEIIELSLSGSDLTFVGRLDSDNGIHWYNSAFGTRVLPDLGNHDDFPFLGDFYVAGTLGLNASASGVDFYAGSMSLYANSVGGTGWATATDNCTAYPGITWSDSSLAGLCPQAETITRTWTATDECGNDASCEQIIHVVDTTPPVMTACPADITVPADAGGCDTEVTFTEPTATDNCDPAPVVVCDWPSGSTFPAGMTTLVTCTATDACGNDSECSFDVTVENVNELAVTVQLEPNIDTDNPLPDTLTRCITFELWECGGPSSVTVDAVIDFAVTAGAPNVAIGSAVIGNYTCITARDKLHTLRRTDEAFPVFSGTQYVADFTGNPGSGGDWLIGGNLNDDQYIDILDFGVFSFQFGDVGDLLDKDTDCDTPAPHADISGDGDVDNFDFSFILQNFLKFHEDNCCGAPLRMADGGVDDGPVTSITVRELRDRGLGHLVVGDLNRDGVLDAQDMAAFADGVRPRPRPKPIQIEQEQTTPVGQPLTRDR